MVWSHAKPQSRKESAAHSRRRRAMNASCSPGINGTANPGCTTPRSATTRPSKPAGPRAARWAWIPGFAGSGVLGTGVLRRLPGPVWGVLGSRGIACYRTLQPLAILWHPYGMDCRTRGPTRRQHDRAWKPAPCARPEKGGTPAGGRVTPFQG